MAKYGRLDKLLTELDDQDIDPSRVLIDTEKVHVPAEIDIDSADEE